MSGKQNLQSQPEILLAEICTLLMTKAQFRFVKEKSGSGNGVAYMSENRFFLTANKSSKNLTSVLQNRRANR